jgi:hypothetical protein
VSTLRPKPISATRFVWFADAREYCIDMSQLGGFGQVYDDACDEGLTLIERHGLREVVCVVEETDVHDGEVKGWRLKPVRGYKGPPFTILVINT